MPHQCALKPRTLTRASLPGVWRAGCDGPAPAPGITAPEFPVCADAIRIARCPDDRPDFSLRNEIIRLVFNCSIEYYNPDLMLSRLFQAPAPVRDRPDQRRGQACAIGHRGANASHRRSGRDAGKVPEAADATRSRSAPGGSREAGRVPAPGTGLRAETAAETRRPELNARVADTTFRREFLCGVDEGCAREDAQKLTACECSNMQPMDHEPESA